MPHVACKFIGLSILQCFATNGTGVFDQVAKGPELIGLLIFHGRVHKLVGLSICDFGLKINWDRGPNISHRGMNIS